MRLELDPIDLFCRGICWERLSFSKKKTEGMKCGSSREGTRCVVADTAVFSVFRMLFKDFIQVFGKFEQF